MTDTRLDDGSFRDPSGRVFLVGGRVLRTVMPCAAEDYEFVRSTGLTSRLIDDGLLLPEQVVDPGLLGDRAAGASYVLEHPAIPYVSYPYEWSFAALKAAALLHLDLHLRSLEQGVTLSDASAYNIQFLGAKPVFIDHLSFRRYREGEYWLGHRQFCEQFVNPLLLRSALGIPHNAWYRGSLEGVPASDLAPLLGLRAKLSWPILFHVVLQARLQRSTSKEGKGRAGKRRALPLSGFVGLLRGLRSWVARLQPADRDRSVWCDYATSHSYAGAEVEAKRGFVTEFVRQESPRTLFDVGCNTGDYAKVALAAGAGRVIGFDFDQGALNRAFERARTEGLDFLPLFLDVANPAPNQGWAERERKGFEARARPDAVLALALIHHLAITRNVPLDSVVNWFIDLAPAGVLEFVPKADPMVGELLKLRADIFPDYDAERFLALVKARASIIRTQVVSPSGRLLVWFRRVPS